ncbi:MAG: alpha/beta hydrolase [Actinomycetota bacterium]
MADKDLSTAVEKGVEKGDKKGGKKRNLRGWGVLLGAIAGGLTAGAAAERAVVRRVRNRPDLERNEPLGALRGTDVGPIVSFDGTTLHVEEAGAGHTVVLSHGYSLDTRLWHYQIRDLAERYRLVLFDQRGHGKSEPAKKGDWSLDALAKDLVAVIEQSTSGRVVVVGHSMGGMAAIKAFELFPELMNERCAGLVLCDTTAADVFPGALPYLPKKVSAVMHGLEEVAMRALLTLDRPTVDKVRRRASDFGWLTVRLWGFGPNASPAHVAFMEKMLAETSIDTWIDLIPAVTGVDVTDGLSKIHVPTLVIVGTHDRLTPPKAAEDLVEGIKGARLGMIAGSGHSPMLECSKTFNARLRVFLERVSWDEAGTTVPVSPPPTADATVALEGPAAAS